MCMRAQYQARTRAYQPHTSDSTRFTSQSFMSLASMHMCRGFSPDSASGFLYLWTTVLNK